MKCLNCGQVNDADAEFCVNCGIKLKTANGLSTSTKLLIVVVIVLVALISVVSGMLLMKTNTPIANNITPITVNNTTNTTPQSNSQESQSNENQITADQAKQIAAQATGQTPTGDVTYNENYNYYKVYLVTKTPGKKVPDYIFVDAATGSIVEWDNGVLHKIN